MARLLERRIQTSNGVSPTQLIWASVSGPSESESGTAVAAAAVHGSLWALSLAVLWSALALPGATP